MSRVGSTVALKATLTSWLELQLTDEDPRKIEDLAQAILEYVRMRIYSFPDQGFTVDVAELAFRFRETEWTIEGALCLLESRGQAKESGGLWNL
jgi:hypothetical protein